MIAIQTIFQQRQNDGEIINYRKDINEWKTVSTVKEWKKKTNGISVSIKE